MSPPEEGQLGFYLLLVVVALVVFTTLVWFWKTPAPEGTAGDSITVRPLHAIERAR